MTREILYVFFGAGIGGVVRMLLGRAALNAFGAGFPFGTMGINITGSFFIGIAATLLPKMELTIILFNILLWLEYWADIQHFQAFPLRH